MLFTRSSLSDMSTNFVILLSLAQVVNKLGQMHILVTTDLVIYKKAQHILWDKSAQLHEKFTTRMGGIHVIMIFLADIGNLLDDWGLFPIYPS